MEIIARSRNPYWIDGPAQIGVSGGRSSGYQLDQILKAHNFQLPPDVYALFENTGKEREETLVFVREFEKRWGVKIWWIEYCRIFGRDDLPRYRIVDFKSASRNGEPFEAMMRYYNAHRLGKQLFPILPNHSNKMCSAYLKTKAAAWFMRERGYERWDAVIGIRRDEPNRYHKFMAANEKRAERWENYLPMYLDGVTQEMVQEFWKNQAFDLGFDSELGNCDLCWKKHPSKIMRAIAEKPERADWWIAHEDRTGQTFRNDGRSFRHLKYYAMQRDKQILMFEPDTNESVDCACTD